MVGSSDFEKGLDHFGGEDGGDHLPSNWGMDDGPEDIYFSTYEEAKQWSLQNVGKAFTRSPDGSGFMPVKRRFGR
jgi:hypothetical protein